jgi:hypothetical protein
MKFKRMEDYLFAVYLQQRVFTVKTVTAYRLAAVCFDSFASGKSRRIDYLDVARFHEWMLNKGYRRSVARNYSSFATTIARHWFPAGPWPKSHVTAVFLHADTPGTLEYAFAHEFTGRARRRVSGDDTRRRYGQTLKLFSEYVARPAALGDLEPRTVSVFLKWLRTRYRLGNWAVGHHAMRLGSLWHIVKV